MLVGRSPAVVAPNSPAARAGLQPGDVILRSRSPETLPARQLHPFVLRSLPGTSLPVDLWREGAIRTIDVVLEEKPR